MEMVNFEAYEDNGGGITLFIIDDNGNAIAAYGNFEYDCGSLTKAIANINNYRSFGGKYGGDIEMPMYFETNDEGFSVPDHEMTIDELYRSWADDETNTMIAWSDGDGINYCDVDHMGFAARKALDVEA